MKQKVFCLYFFPCPDTTVNTENVHDFIRLGCKKNIIKFMDQVSSYSDDDFPPISGKASKLKGSRK